MRHAQTCYKRGRTTCAAQDIRGFFVGGEDAKLEFKIRVAACTQARIQALLCMEDAVLRDSLIKGHDIIWLPQAGWPGIKARKWRTPFNHGLKKVLILEFTRAYASPGDDRTVLPANDEVLTPTRTATLRGFNRHPSTPLSRQRRRHKFLYVCACE